MITLKFRVREQALSLINPSVDMRPVTDAVNQYLCHFDFDNAWDGLNRTAIFKNSSYNIVKNMALNSSGECYIPWEVLENPGTICIEVLGTEVRGEVVTERLLSTLVVLHWNVQEGLLDLSANKLPTPSEYEQFVSNVEEYTQSAIDSAQTASEAATTATHVASNASSFEASASASANAAAASASTASSAATTATGAIASVAHYSELAQGYAEIASSKSEEATTASEYAVSAKSDAEAAKLASETAKGLAEDAQAASEAFKEAAEAAELKIENMTASASKLSPGSDPIVTKTETETGFNLGFGIPQGDTGNGIASIQKTSTSGNIDTYTITYTNGQTTTYQVRNGQDGTGSGDMVKSRYDTNDDGKVNAADTADSVAWSGVTDKPESFPPSTHTHDDRYYTETETEDAITVKDVQIDGVSVLSNKVANLVGLAKTADLSALSGVVDGLVDNYNTHIADTDKHVTSSDKSAWNAKYAKPSGGIPESDLASSVQTSLGKADTALQTHQDISGKVDKSTGNLSIDTSASLGTVDGDLYRAIVALGWESEVIE